MISKVSIKVRGYHLDLFQHVNNARYLEFLEEGRWAFFDDFGEDMGAFSKDIAWAVVNININYRKEAGFGDELEVQTMLSKCSNRSVTMYQKVINTSTEELVADADVTYVCFSREAKAALPLPEAYRAWVEQAIVEKP